MMSIPLLLSLVSGPIHGNLELQVPASDFYYAMESGVVLDKHTLKVGTEVNKDQTLLKYQPESSSTPMFLLSKSDGHVEFIESELTVGDSLSKGQLLFIVTSYKVLGKYKPPVSFNKSALTSGNSIWVCHNSEQWRFVIDEVKGDRLLVSSHLDQASFDTLSTVSKQQAVVSFLEDDKCGEYTQ